MTVRVLEDVVVDQIKAGEVVERPASVLKELLENALDAGATRLDVRLKGGGADLVAVRDDGCGMDEADALLCIERHATSKIRSADDLLDVATLGFRGEALPSIASVSRFELRTRRAEDEVGTALRLEGGRLEAVTPWAGPPGTEVIVRALFANVPARRKFLRSRETELAHALEVVHRVALLRPDVDVTVRHDDREVLRAPATDDPARRVRDLLGADADVLVPVEHAEGGVVVRGLVAPVGVHRPTAAGAIHTFVHGRFVRDAVLRRAVQDAYRGATPAGRFPVVVLDVTVPRGHVDVNVHPAKTEVRFQHPRDVVRVVGEAVATALRARAPTSSPAAAPASREELLFGPPVAEEAPPRAAWASPSPRPSPLPPAALPPSTIPPRPVAPAATAPIERPLPTLRAPTEPAMALLALVDGVALVRRGDVVLAADVAAARRARTAERLREAAAAGGAPSEPLLVPARARLARGDADRLVAAAEALSALGVELTAFGPGELAVVALPAGLDPGDPAALPEALAAALARGLDPADALAARDVSPLDPGEALALVGACEARVLDGASLRAWLRS